MERLAKIEKEELVRRMRAEFERTMQEVTEAVNAAPDGHLIDGSEERARDALGEFRRRAYETALQMRVEATETSVAFPPSGSGPSRGGGSDGSDVQRSGGSASSPLRQSCRGKRGAGR